jgi:hypothetical protein
MRSRSCSSACVQHHMRDTVDAEPGVRGGRRCRSSAAVVNGKDDSRGAWAGRSGPFFAFFSVRGAPCYRPSACIRALRVEALGPEPW